MRTSATTIAIAKDVPRMGWKMTDPRIPLLEQLLDVETRKLSCYNQGLCYICAFAIANSSEILDASANVVEECARVIDTMLFSHRLCLLLDPKSCFLQQYVDNFDAMFCTLLPECYQMFAKCGYDTVYFALDWFTTFFTNALSVDNCLLVWKMVLQKDVGDAFYLAGLAVLSSIWKMKGQQCAATADELFLHFKEWTRKEVPTDVFTEELGWFCSRLIPRVFPHGYSTIKMLEKRVSDPNDILVQLPFDATFFMRAIQAGDASRVGIELAKYAFPKLLLEYALYRACLLGHSSCVSLLAQHCPQQEFKDLPVLLECSAMLCQAMVCRLLIGNFPALLQITNMDQLISRLQELEAQGQVQDAYSQVIAALRNTIGKNTGGDQLCNDCEMRITNANRVTCSRCKFDFCDGACCNTFRQLNGKRFRTCNSCLYYWSGVVSNTATNGFTHAACDLLVDDVSGKPRVCCECTLCLQTFCKLRARHRFAKQRNFVFQVESLAQEALDAKTEQLRAQLNK